MSEIVNENIDKIGEKTLAVISDADKFNKWIYDTIAPYCKGEVIEIGSGLGNISGFLLNNNIPLMLTDLRLDYCEKLHAKFDSYSNLLGVKNIDLIDVDFDQKHKDCLGAFDSVFAINVIEHINDDNLAIKNCYKLLKTGGNLIIMVPSYQALFNDFDRNLGHYRRYNLKAIKEILITNSFNVIHKQYFNFFGILGWIISGSIQKNIKIPKNQMSLYNQFVPLFKIVDMLIFRSLGLSSIVVGEKCV